MHGGFLIVKGSQEGLNVPSIVWCSEWEWNDALEQRAAAEEEARQLEEQRIREEVEAEEVARIEKDKLDVRIWFFGQECHR